MPETSTTITATNAETRAAGTRMLGFVLGGGGAIVDKLLDPANFLTKDGSGRYSIGTASANYLFNAALPNPGRGILADFANHDGAPNGAQISFTQNGIANWCVGQVPGVSACAIYVDRNAAFDGTELWRWESGGTFRPGGDNTQNLAASGKRIANSYFGSSPTVTSDATQKRLRGDGTPMAAEIAWARAIVPRVYQMLDAIAAKGEAEARCHWGVFAQEVYQAGIDAGIDDPFRHGFLGRDARTRTETVMVPGKRQKVRQVTFIDRFVQMRDGRAVLVERPTVRDEPEFTDVPVVDEEGRLVQTEEPMLDDSGAPIVKPGPDGPVAVMRQVPLIHRDPVMEDIEVEQEMTVPVIGEDGEPEYIWNVRYDELILFVWACGVLGSAA